MVTLERFELRQKVMRQINWLRSLHMGVAGHDNVGVFLGQEKKRILQSTQADDDLVNFLAHVEAKVECDLIVAAAGGVQFCPGRPDPFRQRRLDVHVDIFERLVPDEFAVADFGFDLT